jgi:hypothetical protein
MAKVNPETRGRLAELQALDVWLRGATKQFMALTCRDVQDRIQERYEELWRETKSRRGKAWRGSAGQGWAGRGKARQG